MADIVNFTGVTRLDVPVERVIEDAKATCLGHVVIIGYDEDGDMYFASSYADGGNVIWLLEQAKKSLLEQE
jgi:hypothetical protein